MMTKNEYKDLNMFSKKDFEEDEDTATQAEEWKSQEWETSSSMFDH